MGVISVEILRVTMYTKLPYTYTSCHMSKTFVWKLFCISIIFRKSNPTIHHMWYCQHYGELCLMFNRFTFRVT